MEADCLFIERASNGWNHSTKNTSRRREEISLFILLFFDSWKFARKSALLHHTASCVQSPVVCKSLLQLSITQPVYRNILELRVQRERTTRIQYNNCKQIILAQLNLPCRAHVNRQWNFNEKIFLNHSTGDSQSNFEGKRWNAKHSLLNRARDYG